MEKYEFDATLGGTEHLPYSANSLKFAASRSVEIAAMTEVINNPSKTKLIFQTLPVHMRRRVMSHNCKRLPRKLREGHLEQLKKSGEPPKQKRPSRKYRRRPANLLDEYNRRQRQNAWLETHIWHAKRFHMVERWGHKLAHGPCDKAFRACYRATSTHCLIQDISYYVPIQINGPIEEIKDMFSTITSSYCGLSICAKAYINGTREGTIHLYWANKYPFGYIGKVQFIWTPSNIQNKSLWLFVHPSQAKQVESLLTDLLNSGTKADAKRRKLTGNYENVKFKVNKGIFNRFRLTGPKSHSVLVHTLKCVINIDNMMTNHWESTQNNTDFHLQEKHEFWQNISSAESPSQLPPGVIIGLIVKDPRISRPKHRTKAQKEDNTNVDTKNIISIPQYTSDSPLWNTDTCEAIKKKKITNFQFIQHITKTQLVPGEVNENDLVFQTLPVILVQRPGSQISNYKKIGFGSGWDIIIPSGYGIPFWQTFIMFAARPGGLRETENLLFEMADTYLPPDSEAGQEEMNRIESELRDRYFKLPPSKRVNYVKLGINSPFVCPWKILLKDWCNFPISDIFVLRDKTTLNKLQDCLNRKIVISDLDNSSSCLIAIYIQIVGNGCLKRNALICLPEPCDIGNMSTLFEPLHEDINEKLRKQKRIEHLRSIKKLKKKNSKLKRKGVMMVKKNLQKRETHQPSEYVKNMRELWLPSKVESVRYLCTRQTIGYLSEGAFSFSEAKSCGVGYIAYEALKMLLKSGLNKILVRNTCSTKYRLANFQLIKN